MEFKFWSKTPQCLNKIFITTDEVFDRILVFIYKYTNEYNITNCFTTNQLKYNPIYFMIFNFYLVFFNVV